MKNPDDERSEYAFNLEIKVFREPAHDNVGMYTTTVYCPHCCKSRVSWSEATSRGQLREAGCTHA